jgi:DNA-binding CsgD family transcriptional regulator/PAS domain-containing protein
MIVDSAAATRASTDQQNGFSAGRITVTPNDSMSYLPHVLTEVIQLMGARGALLTQHPSNGDPPVLICVAGSQGNGAHDGILKVLDKDVLAATEGQRCCWREVSGIDGLLLVMPVEPLEGHARLLICVLFENINRAARAAAEELYRERRPFAVGFFQVWQQNRMLQQRLHSFESVLDQTAIGLVMLSRTGQMVFANQTAIEILAAGDGIGRSNGKLRATNLADGVNLQAALSHAIASDEQPSSRAPVKAPLIAFRRREGAPLVAAFLPALSPPIEQGDVAAIMYLVDPQIDTGKMLSPLCRLYGLSPVETVLVCHLAAGATIASAAQLMHVKEATARSYLKAIFIKTDTRRQTELVVLMLSSLIRTKREVLQEALTSTGSERALGLRG